MRKAFTLHFFVLALAVSLLLIGLTAIPSYAFQTQRGSDQPTKPLSKQVEKDNKKNSASTPPRSDPPSTRPPSVPPPSAPDITTKDFEAPPTPKKPAISPTPTSETKLTTQVNEDEGDSHFWFYIILGFFGLVSASGPLLAWLQTGGISDSISQMKKQLRGDAAQNSKKLKTLEDENAGLRRQLGDLNTKLNQHANAINKISMQSKDLKGQLIEVQHGAQLESLQSLRNERPFPKPVADLLAEQSGNGQGVAFDDIKKCLVEDISGGQHFLLYQGDLGGSDKAYVVPSLARFATRNDYLSFYQNFYRCDFPGGGEVWIKELAIVRRIPQGWELDRAGELEVR